MQTIGKIISKSRRVKGFTLIDLEKVTKIRLSFLEAIEKENWDNLPAFPVILGFVKTIASFLDIEEKTAIAFLKRDYPPKRISINPKPDVSNKKTWSPKLTFIGATALVFIIMFGYLTFEYFRFTSAPALTVDSPKNEQVVIADSVVVFGSTDADSKITVNNQPVLTDKDGKFSVTLKIAPSTKEVVIKATSRSGKETVVSRTIVIQ